MTRDLAKGAAMTKAKTKTYDHFDDVPVIPRRVTYSPTRDGRARWVVHVIQLDRWLRIDAGPFWHTWNRDLAEHFHSRIDTVVHVGGVVTTKGSTSYVSITSTRFAERPTTEAEWDELHDAEQQMAAWAEERPFAAPTSTDAVDA
jgi:hypothetical protein